MTSNRKPVTEALHIAATSYLTKMMYSVHKEVGVLPWGKRRVDIFAFSTKLDFIVCEVKSGAADFNSDKKWVEYLPYCNKFYFVVSDNYWSSSACDAMRAAASKHGAGILVLNPKTGKLESKQKGKGREMRREHVKELMIKLAWRGGAHRGNTRFQRVFIGE